MYIFFLLIYLLSLSFCLCLLGFFFLHVMLFVFVLLCCKKKKTMYRLEVSRSARSRSHTMAYTYRTRAQIPQLRARQSTNSALRQESNRRDYPGLRISARLSRSSFAESSLLAKPFFPVTLGWRRPARMQRSNSDIKCESD